MSIVAIESPFRAETKKRQREHLALAVGAMEYALSCGLAPFASHLLYTMPLSDATREQHAQGITAGYSFAGPRWFVLDYGWTDGMRRTREECTRRGWRVSTGELSNVYPQWERLIDSPRIKHLRKALYW